MRLKDWKMKHHPVAVLGCALLREVFYKSAAKKIFARVVVVEDAENVEQCGLARARRAHDGDELALPDVEVYALEHVERLRAVVGLVDVF